MDVLVRMVGILLLENGVIEWVCVGIDEVISCEQFIFFDCEKGLFMFGIYVFDELLVWVFSCDIMKQNWVIVYLEKSVFWMVGYSDVVSVLVQDCLLLVIVFGQGGVVGQCEWVVELVMMVWEQGWEVQIIVVDCCLQMNMKQDEWLFGELIIGCCQLLEGMVFMLGSIVIVDQGEKFFLKEMLILLDGVVCYNVQVLIIDSGQ